MSFFFTFAYLFFFRMTEFFGIPYPPSHTNLVQMIVTLKVNNVFILNIYVVVFLGRNLTNCVDGRH
jgi:type IV secretory pathway VirB3-like protein